MTLTDTGPLVALVDRNDVHHQACSEQLAALSQPMVTVWPCFTEAMHLLERAGGHPVQDALWEYVALEMLLVRANDEAAQTRMRVLMADYEDRPMDLADAALVAAAEALGMARVFSVDSNFTRYSNGRKAHSL